MSERQFLWGLSNGVMVFAITGAFWLGLWIGTAAPRIGGLVCAVSTVLQVGICAALLWAAVRLRRKSGFRRSELRQAEGRRSPETQHILAGLRWTIAGQTALIAFAVWACVRAGSEQLIWPAIALVVSLHLIPLAKIFHVRAYYGTAAAGSVVSIMSITGLAGAYAVESLAAGMATVMWISALYLLWKADAIAASAVGERWAA
jgi:hypothetical protein